VQTAPFVFGGRKTKRASVSLALSAAAKRKNTLAEKMVFYFARISHVISKDLPVMRVCFRIAIQYLFSKTCVEFRKTIFITLKMRRQSFSADC
jgi:hypothetical protein